MSQAPASAWSGRLGFILATVGSAVGIGSIWKFPYEVGANGGSFFVLFYLLGLVLAVVPLMFAEFAIGRRGRGDAVASIATVARAHGAGRRWAWVGVLGVTAGFLILSFYSVIAGWTLGYAIETAIDGLPGSEPALVQARFDDFLGSPLALLGWHGAFMALSALIVVRGVAAGIEAAVRVLMPVLVLLLVFLAAYAVLEGDLATTLRFLFRLDTAELSGRAALEAVGLGFFSISVGLGMMITYASYGGSEVRLTQVAIVSVLADTAISFLAGFAVFPIVFAQGLDPASGPGLVFVTLPLAFAAMPGGTLVAIAFFVLLCVAALASAISVLELVVAAVMRRLAWSRTLATWSVASACFLAGIGTVLSFNLWADWHPLGTFAALADATVFDLVDQLTSNLMLPLGGLLIALFAGWALPSRLLGDELALSGAALSLLRLLLRYVAPAVIIAAGLAPLVFDGVFP